MGNCGSNPKTKEGPEPVPKPVTLTEEVTVEQGIKESAGANVETKTEETHNEDNKSLGTLLNENVEEAKKPEEGKAEAVDNEVKAEPSEPKGEKAESKEVKAEPNEVKAEAQEAKTESKEAKAEPKEEEPKTKEVKVQEEKPKTEEAKTEA